MAQVPVSMQVLADEVIERRGARVSQRFIWGAFMMTLGSSSNTSPGIWVPLMLGGLLVVFVLTALIVSVLIHS